MDLEKYYSLNPGTYEIGISEDTLESIKSVVTCGEIKEEYIQNSLPRHTVNIGRVSIGRRPVTLNEFSDFINDTGYITEAEQDGWGWVREEHWIKKEGASWRSPFNDSADEIYRENKKTVPVLQVSWNDAVKYCQWLSSSTRGRFRLPHEKEWEIFAELNFISSIEEIEGRNKDTGLNSPGDFITKLLENIGKNNYNGLIWEWCEDWFSAYPNGGPNKDFGETYKVLRGGSLLSHPVQRSREFRFRRCPTARSAYYGFRLALY